MNSSRLLAYIIGGVVAFVLIIIGLSIMGVFSGSGGQAVIPLVGSLTVWGIQDDSGIWHEIIQEFQKKHQLARINYYRLYEGTYEETLIDRIAAGAGPDVFMLPNDLIAEHKDKIALFPQSQFGFFVKDYQNVFVDGLYEELTTDKGEIIGFPLFLDTPVLFYNKDILNSAGYALVPNNWEDLLPLVKQFTVKTQPRDIVKSGLAIGTYRNVNNAFDIVSSLFLQFGDPIITFRPTYRVTLETNAVAVFNFYTSFANPSSDNFAWTSRLTQSLDAFAQGDAAMAIGFAQDIDRIRARSPHLAFGVAPFPQPKGIRRPVVYGRYFFPAVYKNSSNQRLAWEFVSYVTRGEGANIYIEKTKRPPARRDIIAAGGQTAQDDVFYRQSLIAREWYIPNGSATRLIFEDAVESIVTRSATVEEGLRLMKDKMRQFIP